MKEILFIHSAGPQNHHEGSDFLVSYLRAALGSGYGVRFPKMPDHENPRYDRWKVKIREALKTCSHETVLIGHSLGGSSLLKFLSEESPGNRVKALFVIAAPYWGIEGWEVEEFMLQENFSSKLEHIQKIFLYHSTDDEVVTFHHLAAYAKELPQAETRIFKNQGHLFGRPVPELIEDIHSLFGDSTVSPKNSILPGKVGNTPEN